MMAADSHTLLQRNRELFILNHIAETLNRTTDMEAALADTLASVVELLGLQTGWIFLLDDTSKLDLAAHHDLPPALTYPGEPWCGGCNCHSLFKSGELRTAVNIVQCSRLAEAEGDRRGLEFHASAPLRSEDRMLGILNVASPGWDTFTPDTLLLLSAVGAQLGTALERARLAQHAVALAALEERNRIAREIHDTLAQGLTAITLHLEAAQALADTKPDVAQRKIAQALGLARTNLEEARRSVLDLRAAPLEGRTLAEALRLLVQQFGDETSTKVEAVFDPLVSRLTPARESGLYRIVQEALANVRKHARASHVTLRLERDGTHTRLTIEDNGVGFDPEQVTPTASSGFGITGMSERAYLMGGQFELHSAVNSGTRVCVSITNDQ